MKKCYVTYRMTYEVEVPEEDLNDLYYDDEDEDSPWRKLHDPSKVEDYFNGMLIDWAFYDDISLEQVKLPDDIFFY